MCLPFPTAATISILGQTMRVNEDQGTVQVNVGVLTGSLGVNLPLLLRTATLQEDTAVGMYGAVNSPVYLVCDALVEVLWLLCIVYVIRVQPVELPR